MQCFGVKRRLALSLASDGATPEPDLLYLALTFLLVRMFNSLDTSKTRIATNELI